MTGPDYWLSKFSKLRIDRARGDPAPREKNPAVRSNVYWLILPANVSD